MNDIEKKFAYVELVFYPEARNYFKKIVKDIVPKEQFYYSDVISRIKGDVSDKTHFTLFYGLDESVLDSLALAELLNRMQIESLKLEKLVLFDGYQNLYKVLCIEVNDEDRSLSKLSKKMLEFDHDEAHGMREFKAHITLAYVQHNYSLPKAYSFENKEIRVKKIELKI